MAACQQGVGVAPFQEEWRDTHDFARRISCLPEQRDGDVVDYRGLLHRDGSVLSALSLQVRRVGLPCAVPSQLCCCSLVMLWPAAPGALACFL